MPENEDRERDESLWRAIIRLEERVESMEASQTATQSDIDAITATLGAVTADLATLGTDITTVSTDLGASVTTLQAEINDLAAKNPGLDVSALQAAAAPIDANVQALTTAATNLDAAVKAAGALVPQSVTPPPPPAAPTKSVYTFGGDPTTIDPTVWATSGFETAPTDGSAPVLLYYFSGDVNPGDATGNGLDGGLWVLYVGPTQPVA